MNRGQQRPVMTPEQFRTALAALGLSQSGFARVARVDPRTVRKWAAGDRAIPGPVVVLLELLAAQKRPPGGGDGDGGGRRPAASDGGDSCSRWRG